MNFRNIPHDQILKFPGSNKSLVDIKMHPNENKVIVVEQKEISFTELKHLFGNTTNLIADVQIEPQNVRVELESERRMGDASDIIVDDRGIRSYIDSKTRNKDRQTELRLDSIKKRDSKKSH